MMSSEEDALREVRLHSSSPVSSHVTYHDITWRTKNDCSSNGPSRLCRSHGPGNRKRRWDVSPPSPRRSVWTRRSRDDFTAYTQTRGRPRDLRRVHQNHAVRLDLMFSATGSEKISHATTLVHGPENCRVRVRSTLLTYLLYDVNPHRITTQPPVTAEYATLIQYDKSSSSEIAYLDYSSPSDNAQRTTSCPYPHCRIIRSVDNGPQYENRRAAEISRIAHPMAGIYRKAEYLP
ncbi:hypothetical protein CHU98_g6607 [Xylaria longipes]|nr:hypothetical protein CHU98_g6607 [Xylaria longipes]